MLGFPILQATAPMKFKRRRRRRRRQLRKEPKEAVDAENSRRIHGVTDDLLWRILLHLDSPLWLLRAACVCKRWRRIVDGTDGGRAFLRLASSLHPPAVVGHYHSLIGGGHRFVRSSPPAPIDGGRFSLDFIPWDLITDTASIEDWKVADCHGGLVLLRDRDAFLSDLVVCDPLTRRCRWIRHPPDRRSAVAAGHYFANIFLIDGDNGNTSISNFRVLYRAVHDDGRVSRLYLFSMAATAAGGGDWRLLRRSSQPDDRYRDGVGRVAGRVDGSLYLGSGNGIVTVLDNAKLKFNKVDLPIHVEQSGPYSLRSTFAVIHGAASPGPDPASPPPPPAACIVHVRGEKLELFCQVHGRGGEWVLEHSIPNKLSRATRGLPGYPLDEKSVRWVAVEVIAGGPGYALLSVWLSDRGMAWQFSFNVDTMELQSVPDEAAHAYRGTSVTSASTYSLPWPQFLRACPR